MLEYELANLLIKLPFVVRIKIVLKSYRVIVGLERAIMSYALAHNQW